MKMNMSYNIANPLFSRKLLLILAIGFLLVFTNCNTSNNKTGTNNSVDEISGNLIIFHAGSLSIPMKEIAAAFNKKYPKVNIMMEPAGSVECARKITELNKPCDIFASSDYKVIDKLLIPKYTDWNIKFAANELIIAYNNNSKYADKISKSNWHEILLKKEILFGRADPNTDPCGYRSVLAIQLAEKYYHKNSLEAKLLIKDNNYIRPKETDLIALLESNAVDYIFLYRSLAEQHKLTYILLPDSINLKKIEYADFYNTAKIAINGKKPGEMITQFGEPMVYGITILKDAPNLKAANAFVEFLLNENNGMKIMENNGQPSVVPSKTEYYDKIPDALKQYVIK